MNRWILFPALAWCTAAVGQFGAFSPIGAYTAPAVQQVLDLDDDGDVDVLLTSANRIFAQLNDGTGQFADPVPFTALGSDQVFSLTSIGAFDADGDGDLDLVHRPYDADSTYWFRNDPGGAFVRSTALTFTPYNDLRVSFPADVDLDGDQDLIASPGAANTYLFLNDGNGGLTPGIDIPTGLVSVNDLDLGDMDGDGDLDLLVVHRFFGNATLVVCEHLDGAGTFDDGVLVGPPPDAIGWFGCGWLDMDGDGDLDAAVSQGGDLAHYPNTDGQGTFGAIVPGTLGAGSTRSWDVADHDGDGDNDLMAATAGGVTWIEHTGPGQFIRHGPLALPVDPEVVRVADVDANGHQDLVFSTETLLCTGVAYRGPTDFTGWQHLTAAPVEARSTRMADMDGDGTADFVGCASTNDAVYWYPIGNGTMGAFASHTVTMNADSALAIATGDTDGDGDQDIMVAEGRSGELTLCINADGSGTSWAELVIASGLQRPNKLTLHDIDADGDPDALFTTAVAPTIWYALNTAGTFGAPQAISVLPFAPLSLEVADLNNDGRGDVLISGATLGVPQDLVWYEALPGGLNYVQHLITSTGSFTALDAAANDIDQDGDIDVVLASTSSTGIRVFLNNGGGVFSGEVTISTAAVRGLDAGDLDSDGLGDVAYFLSGANKPQWLRHLGGLSFDPPADISSVSYPWSGIGLYDMDADGDQDVHLHGSSATRCGTVENFFGGPFQIGGHTFLDLDGSGDQSGGDVPAPYVMVSTSPSNALAYTNGVGDYLFYLDSGAHTVQAELMAPCWGLTTDSAAYHETLTMADPVRTGRDFGYGTVCDTTHVLLTHSLADLCEELRTLTFHLVNLGTTGPEGSLRVVLDPLVAFVQSQPAPTQVDGDTIWLPVPLMGAFEHRVFTVDLDGPGAAFIGDTIHFSSRFDAQDDQGGPIASFEHDWSQIILCAYDPNDKTVEPAGHGEQGLIPVATEELMYRIRFQNTGNDTATTVRLHDRLPPELDRTTLELLGWTHPFTLRIEADGEAVFQFDNILLPDSSADFEGSQGHVIFKLRLHPGLPAGTVIRNEAFIYFDANPPIITNTAVNTLYDCSLATAAITDLGGGLLLASSGEDYQWWLDGTPIAGADDQQYAPVQSGTFTVVVTDSIGCTPVSPGYVFVITGQDVPTEASVSFHPVPFTDQLDLFMRTPLAPGSAIEVRDATGKLVLRAPMVGDRSRIDGRTWSPGAYVVSAIGPAGERSWRSLVVKAAR